jgi:gliding motility-associated lipoprotein GldH
MAIFASGMNLLKKLTAAVLLALTAGLIFPSCQGGRVFEEYRKLDDYTWKRFDNIVFEAEIEDTGASYNIYIAIRHITQYPFKNLMITAIMKTPSGEERYLEYDLKIRDDEGKPLGNGMGDLWDINIPLRKNFRFRNPGKVVMEFENRMSRPTTPGIMEIGLIIEKI